MVTFNFKLIAREQVNCPLARPDYLETVLQQYADMEGITIGGYIAVREGKVIRGKNLIDDSDVIDIFPAISGG